MVNHSNGGTTNKDVLSDVQSDALHYTLPCLSTGQSLPGSQATEQSVHKAIFRIVYKDSKPKYDPVAQTVSNIEKHENNKINNVNRT